MTFTAGQVFAFVIAVVGLFNHLTPNPISLLFIGQKLNNKTFKG